MNAFILIGVIGPWQIVIILVIILLIFGGKKIPELMRGLGEGIKEFKKASKDNSSEIPDNEDKSTKKEVDDKNN